MRALDRERFEVIPIGITSSGTWVLVQDDPGQWDLTDGRLPEVTGDAGPEIVPPLDVTSTRFTVLEPGRPAWELDDIDVVFPLLHGPFGEDGTVQGMLELADMRYVGSGVIASAVGMDKHFMKVVLGAQGIPVGPYVVVTPRRWATQRESVQADVEELGYPVFVKPARAGSSLGITKVTSPADLAEAIERARRHDPKIVIESTIEGREIECAVLDSPEGSAPAASLPGEIVVRSGHDFYDFRAKYLDGSSVDLICPAELSDEVVHRVRELAVRTFEVLGCEGLARVDFFVLPDGEVVVNEINTMPGFTPVSMYPRMWERTGLPYPELVDRLIRLALARPTGLR
jgi:D-alanine-D-alanine ligase